MIALIFIIGLLSVSGGYYWFTVYTLPLIGLPFSDLISTMPVIDALLGVSGLFCGPVLMIRGIIICGAIIWAEVESRW